jgi:site-specific recombinase XerD
MIEITTPTVQEFYEWIKVNPLPGRHRRGSQKTIDGYASDLERFARWFAQSTGHELSADALTPDDIQDFLGWLQTAGGRKPSTVLRYFSAIRTYCLYLQKTDERILRDLSDGIRLPRQEKMTRRGLRRKERLAVERVFTVPWKNTEISRLRLVRDYALVETMMYVGLRVEAITKLKLSNLILSERSGSIRVRQGKGNADRIAGIPLKARQALTNWLEIRKDLDCDHDFVFAQLRAGHNSLGTRSVQHMVKEVGSRAKLDIELTPHILRHTAIRIWRKNTDDRTTAAQMGHSVATMMKYDSIAEDDVLIAAEKI